MNIRPEIKIFDVNQDCSGQYTAVLMDGAGEVVSSASLVTATLTLFDPQLDQIINSREAQDVLNANDVAIDTDGNLTWSWQAEDMPKLRPGKNPEVHIAVWEFTWANGQMKHEVHFRVHRISEFEG